jgi:hypothetical protein
LAEQENIKTVITAMAKRVAELNQQLDMLCYFINRTAPDEDRHKGPEDLYLPWSREEKLKSVIKEAVEELEESRKSFKSKRLEILRKKMTQALMDLN